METSSHSGAILLNSFREPSPLLSCNALVAGGGMLLYGAWILQEPRSNRGVRYDQGGHDDDD